MIEYWPDKQGINLNNEVAQLFLKTRYKFKSNLLNKTNIPLYIDVLDNANKHKLFTIVLNQLEILILDIIELDLSIRNVQLLNHKILSDLIQKSLINFINRLKIEDNSIKFMDKLNCLYLQIILLEHKLLLENLLIYLIFGSSYLSNEIFAFDSIKTPKKHVSILLDNLIIQVSNLVIFMIFENLKSVSNIIYFLIHYKLCHSLFISNRSIASFRNNLIWQNIVYFYINQPKAMYNARYQVWLINSQRIYCKYIYAYRIEDLSKLSSAKMVFIFFIEIQDIIMPQIEKFLLILSKIFLYIFINILGNSTIFIIRTITSNFYNIEKK